MKNLALAAIAPLLLALPASSGDLIPEIVPADASWLLHVDLEAFQESVLWKSVLELDDLRTQFDQGMAEAREELGFDPLTLVKSATLYGESGDAEEGVAVLVVSPDVEALLERFSQEQSYSSQTLDGRLVHVWSESADDPVFAHIRRFDGVANRLVFLSDSPQRLMRGVDVLEGKRKDVTQAEPGGLSARPSPGSFVYLETGEDIPGLDEVDAASAISALAKGLRFQLGESAGQLSAELVVTTNNAQDALNVHSVLQGLTAFASLALPEDVPAEVRNIVSSLRFTANGALVAAEFRYDSRSLIQLVRTLAEEH